jgi:hypothetical protein
MNEVTARSRASPILPVSSHVLDVTPHSSRVTPRAGRQASALGPYSRDGVTDAQFRKALADHGFSGTGGAAVGPDTLVKWYDSPSFERPRVGV